MLSMIAQANSVMDKDGMLIVIELKRDAIGNVVLSKLFKYTPLQTSYGINNIALVNGRPMVLNLKDLVTHFIDFRIEVIVRRTKFDLRKAEERAHILEGLLIALDNLDEVIALIRGSKTVEEARTGLITTFKLSEIQAKAILDMRLQKLTGLESAKIREEHAELQKTIAYLKSILESEEMQKDIVKGELAEMIEKYGDDRRTQIEYADGEISIEDMIPDERVVVTISHLGYIKRTKVTEYKTQNRGGRGSRGSKTREADFIEHMFVASTHNYLLLFTEQGRCHWLRVYEIPEASKASQGRVIQNIISLPKDDKVMAYINIENLEDEDFINNNYILFATRKGIVKKTVVEAFSRPRTNGINAITINEGDQLLEAKLTSGNMNVFLASSSGMAIRFEETRVRPMGRNAAGVKGMQLKPKNDRIIGMVCVDPEDEFTTILVVSEKGSGKRSKTEEYRTTNRGGKGIKTMQMTSKTGELVAIKAVFDDDDLMITNRSGIVIRMAVKDIRVMGRSTQGVRVITLHHEDSIADIAVVRNEDDDDSEE